MRSYEYHEINEISNAFYRDGKTHQRFDYENNLLKKSNPILIGNFNKVAKWIETNCPTLNGEFDCRHNPYHWVKLVVENGKAYIECGSHGWGFDIAMSTTETAVFTRGSIQDIPYAFEGCQFFRNDSLEEFLSQWQAIKIRVIGTYNTQKNVYSESFEV
jgi:hypothetical protein